MFQPVIELSPSTTDFRTSKWDSRAVIRGHLTQSYAIYNVTFPAVSEHNGTSVVRNKSAKSINVSVCSGIDEPHHRRQFDSDLTRLECRLSIDGGVEWNAAENNSGITSVLSFR